MKMCRRVVFLLLVLSVLSGCSAKTEGQQEGNLSQTEVETFAKDIFAKSNYCSTISGVAEGDYRFTNISFDSDRYERYLVHIEYEASAGHEYVPGEVYILFRYYDTQDKATWAQSMVFSDEYSIDDFKAAVNWGENATWEADWDSFQAFTKQEKETASAVPDNSPESEPTDQPPLSEPSAAADDPLTDGTWWQEGGGRCHIQFEGLTDKSYAVTVSWADSASENLEWTMTAIRDDEDGNRLNYSDCVKRAVTYGDSGSVLQDVTAYTDGQGYFYLSGETLAWSDEMGNIAIYLEKVSEG